MANIVEYPASIITGNAPDNGQFRINDITLNIPPTEIKINRQSFNHRYMALRTRNTVKTKSGYSVITIRVAATFDDRDGFEDLRKLIAQLRVMPFCFIENKYLRNAILEGNPEPTMVFALRNINIRKSDTDTNIIRVIFDFAWFNYSPFMRVWRYRIDMFSSLTVLNPEQSNAWKLLYQAEMMRNNYLPIKDELTDNLAIAYWEYISISIGDKKVEDVLSEYDHLKKLSHEYIKSSNYVGAGNSEFPLAIEPPINLEDKAEDFFGYGTSMGSNLFSEVIGKVGDKTYKYKGLTWEPVCENGEVVEYSGRLLFRRKAAIRTKECGIIVTGIDISFQHMLATIPLIGQTYATFQHIGSTDSSVSVQMMTTSQTPLKLISHFYNTIEGSALSFPQIPAEARRLVVANDIINLCGITECITEQLHITTLPGQVGTYAINLILSDDKFIPLQHKFHSEFAFSSPQLRKTISETLLKYIKFNPDNAMSKYAAKMSSLNLPILGYTGTVNGTVAMTDPYEEGGIGGLVQAAKTIANPAFTALEKPICNFLDIPYSPVAYMSIKPNDMQYMPYICNISESDIQKRRLRAFVTDYSILLSKLYVTLRTYLVESSRTIWGGGGKSLANFADSDAGIALANVLALSEEDIPGLKKIQEDLIKEYVLGEASKTDRDKVTSDTNKILNSSKAWKQLKSGEYVTNKEKIISELEKESKLAFQLNRLHELQKDITELNSQHTSNLDIFTKGNAAYNGTKLSQATDEFQSLMNEVESDAKNHIESQLTDVKNTANYLKALYKERRLNRSEEILESIKQEIENETGEAVRAYTEDKLNRKGIDETIWGYILSYRKQFQRMVDTWIQRGIVAEDKAFEPIIKQINLDLMNTKGSVAYPDFPTNEILSILHQKESSSYFEFGEYLFKLWKEYGAMVKGLSPSVFINPDFFLINEMTDVVGDLFDKSVITDIMKMVKDSLAKYKVAEKTIFQTMADKHKEREALLYRTAEESLEKLVQSNEENKLFNNTIEKEMELELEERGIAPYDFTDSSLAFDSTKSAEREGEGINLPIIEEVKDTVKNLWYSYTRTGEDASLKHPDIKDEERIIHRLGGLGALEKNQFAAARSEKPVKDIRPISLDGPKFWLWPVPGFEGKQFISSPYGERSSPHSGKKTFHSGIDIATRRAQYGSRDREIKNQSIIAAASGRITKVIRGNYFEEQQYKDFQEDSKEVGIRAALTKIKEQTGTKIQTGQITINHGGGWESVYLHIQNEEEDPNFSDLWYRVNKIRENPFVEAGQEIALVGATGLSNPKGYHLHFEVRYKGKALNPEDVLNGSFITPNPISAEGYSDETLLEAMIGDFEKNLITGQGRGLLRAFPTFKLYFIESDFGERTEFGFDDFFSYASVRDIQFIDNRKIPASVCKIELNNISGVLSNRKFTNDINEEDNRYYISSEEKPISNEDMNKPENANSSAENPLSSLLLQPGIQVQLRLGYNNNPMMLERIFNGIITEVQFTENDDGAVIIAQSFGTELTQRIKGYEDEEIIDRGDTKNVIERLLSSTELVHFGRWEPQQRNQGAFDSTLLKRWSARGNPIDQNIFAPGGESSFNLFRIAHKYHIYRKTVWDILQEMTFRHPGYIARAVPYEDWWGPRMTLFFGLPNQYYYSRTATYKETQLGDLLDDLLKKVENNKTWESTKDLKEGLADPYFSVSTKQINELQKEISKINKVEIDRSSLFKVIKKCLAFKFKMQKPFCSYHMITSDSHIIANNLGVTAKKTFNAVNLRYTTDASTMNLGTASPEESVVVNKSTSTLETSVPDIFSMKSDVDLPDEEVRELFAYFPNCVGEEQAKRYALSILWNSLKEGYEGSIVIIGNPAIKPYDIVLVADRYSDIYGLIEVEQVIHRFSPQNGFITEIKPNMMIDINQFSTMITNDVMTAVGVEAVGKMGGEAAADLATRGISLIREVKKTGINLLSNIGTVSAFKIGSMVNPAIGVLSAYSGWQSSLGAEKKVNNIISTTTDIGSLAMGPGGFLLHKVAGWGAQKIVSRSQLDHPFRFTPLIYKGIPLMRAIKHQYAEGGLLYQGFNYINTSLAGLWNKIGKTREQFRIERWDLTRGSDLFDYALEKGPDLVNYLLERESIPQLTLAGSPFEEEKK